MIRMRWDITLIDGIAIGAATALASLPATAAAFSSPSSASQSITPPVPEAELVALHAVVPTMAAIGVPICAEG